MPSSQPIGTTSAPAPPVPSPAPAVATQVGSHGPHGVSTVIEECMPCCFRHAFYSKLFVFLMLRVSYLHPNSGDVPKSIVANAF